MEKIYIIKNTNELPKEDRMLVLKFVQTLTNRLSESADGCRINLDKLPDIHIHKLYLLIKNRVEYQQIMGMDI